MKSTLLKYLPMAAALTIATACSNDDENIIVPQPVLEAESVQPASVKVPFSIKVENGTKSLTKMLTQVTQEGDKKSMTFSFDDDDIDKYHYVVYITEWTENEYLSEDYQYLTLSKNEKNEFVFTGELSVNKDKLEDFNAGKCTLTADLMEMALLDYYKSENFKYEYMFPECPDGKSLSEVLYLESDFSSNATSFKFGSPYVYFNIEIEDPKNQMINFYIKNGKIGDNSAKIRISKTIDPTTTSWVAVKVALGDFLYSPNLGITIGESLEGDYKIFKIKRSELE